MNLQFFNPKTNKFQGMTKKTLNDHLFDTLERLAAATPETIQNEIDKAASIITVSEQVLNVARLKLEIITAGEGAVNQFTEIDNTDMKALPQSGEQEVKKN